MKELDVNQMWCMQIRVLVQALLQPLDQRPPDQSRQDGGSVDHKHGLLGAVTPGADRLDNLFDLRATTARGRKAQDVRNWWALGDTLHLCQEVIGER